MMLRLQYSGYDRKFREELVRSALATYNRPLDLDGSGEKALYRPREWKALDRARERRKRRDNWFRKGGSDTVIFVPATPGSQLKRRYMREMKATDFKIKVVEQSGTTLKAMLQRSDLNKQRRCVNADCLLCRTDGKGSYRSTGVTYELVCQASKSKYVGETSRTAYTRGREHLHALERRMGSSVMRRHCCDRHDRNEVNFVMNVTGVFRDDAMLRQITESEVINKVEEGKLINSKSEWNYVRIPRAVVTL